MVRLYGCVDGGANHPELNAILNSNGSIRAVYCPSCMAMLSTNAAEGMEPVKEIIENQYNLIFKEE